MGWSFNYSKCKASGEGSFKAAAVINMPFMSRENPENEAIAATLFEQKWKISALLLRMSPASDFEHCHWVMVKPDENSAVLILKNNSSGWL